MNRIFQSVTIIVINMVYSAGDSDNGITHHSGYSYNEPFGTLKLENVYHIDGDLESFWKHLYKEDRDSNS